MRPAVVLRAALACLAAATLAADPGPLAARGKDIAIPRAELDAAFAHYKAELLSTGRLLSDEQVPSVRAQLLDRLVLVHLCRARAKPGDLVKAELDSHAFIQGLKREHGEAGFRRLLERAGYQEPDFATNKLAEAIVTAVIDREVKREIRIPTDDKRKFYEENPDRWVEPAVARVAWLPLLLADPATGAALPEATAVRKRALAAELRDRARKGEDFAALVRAHADDPRARERGGEQRVVRGQAPAEFEEPAFRLEPGGVSDVIAFDGGIGILKVLAREPARKRAFEEVETQIHDLLVQRELQARLPEFVARMRRESALEVVGEPAAGR